MLVSSLKEKGKELAVEEVMEYDSASDSSSFDSLCKQADFIYYLEDTSLPCSYDLVSRMLLSLQKYNNACPIVLKSYEKAMTKGTTECIIEELFFQHEENMNAPIMVYRLPEAEFLKEHMDELIEEMLDALVGKEHRCNYNDLAIEDCEDGRYCYVPVK